MSPKILCLLYDTYVQLVVNCILQRQSQVGVHLLAGGLSSTNYSYASSIYFVTLLV